MMYEVGICSECHQEKKIKNKELNLCTRCYNNSLVKIGICSECHQEKKIANKKLNLCTSCYNKTLSKVGICSGCHQEKKIKNKELNLCTRCYNNSLLEVGICSECKHEKIIANKGLNLCKACNTRKLRARPGYTPKQRIGTCSKCHRTRPLVTADDLCNSCHVQDYKKRTGYKGPVRKCSVCGEETNIQAKDMCRSCYNHKYEQDNRGRLTAKKREARRLNPEKFREWDRNWRKNNSEKFKAHRRKYYHENIEKMRASKRKYYREHQEEILKRMLERRIEEGIVRETKKIQDDELLLCVPELKRVHLIEFLSTVYKDRAPNTKHKFLLDLVRLLGYIEENVPNSYLGSWNLIKLTDIENCQIETGSLKDSLRVFFRWLKNRKTVNIDLSAAIPTETTKWNITEINVENLSDIVNRFYNIEENLELRIVGLLIIFHLCKVDQLRRLKVADFSEGKIFLNGTWSYLDEKLWELVDEYKAWREKMYFGMAPDYFFVTGYTVTSQSMVGGSHFSSLFKYNNVGVSPHILRKAMMFFHKNNTGMDPFELAAISGITPRAATRY